MNKTVFCKIHALFRFVSVLIACFVGFAGFTQSGETVTVHLKDAPLEEVLHDLESQTGYVFLNRDVDIRQRVSLDVTDRPVSEVLELLFTPKNINFGIESGHIVISVRKEVIPTVVSGRVLDPSGAPVVGAAVIVKGTTVGTSSGPDGSYTLRVPPPFLGECGSRCQLFRI